MNIILIFNKFLMNIILIVLCAYMYKEQKW